jgi:hypothetical protein
MAGPDHTRLKNVGNFGEDLLSNRLEANLKAFYDWALLSSMGAWFDVTIPEGGPFGGDFSTLRLVDDPAFSDGQVWETIRKDLVYETGVDYSYGGSTYNPISISGVWVDDTFYLPSDSTYGHHVNYPLGRVIFDNAIATTSTVQMNYSFRQVQTLRADQVPHLQELQFGSYRPDDEHFETTSTGTYSQFSNQRIQMPCVVFEVVGGQQPEGWQIGSGSQRVEVPVLAWVFSEERWSRNQLVDIMVEQNDKNIWLFNTTDAQSEYPLDFRGEKTSPNMYPHLVDPTGYQWKRCRFLNVTSSDVQSENPFLFKGVVRTNCEIYIDGDY